MLDNAVDKIRDLFEDLISDKKTIIKIGAILLILVIAAVLRIHGASKSDVNIENASNSDIESEDADNTSSADLCVDIGGAVQKPGVYEVSEGTRLYQVIELAGGLTEEADTDSINRASYVEDGEKIIIPSANSNNSSADNASSSDSASVSAGGASSSDTVNINIADKEELKTLNGIGDVMADRIIEYRKSNRFKSKEDIKSVKGIGDGIYEKIKDSITC